MIKKIGIFCIQVAMLILIYQLGNYIESIFHLRIPGNVIGMLILFGLLWLKIIKIDQIKLAADFLLKHLGFFFIPIAVGLMTLGHLLFQKGLSILLVLSFSAIIGLVSAGRATQFLINKRKEAKVNLNDHTV